MSELDRPTLTRRDFLIGLVVATGVLTPLAIMASDQPSQQESPSPQPAPAKKETIHQGETRVVGGAIGAAAGYAYSRKENESEDDALHNGLSTVALVAAGSVLGASAGQMVGRQIKK